MGLLNMLHVTCRMGRFGILNPDSLVDLRCNRRVPVSLLASVFILCHLAPHAASQELLFDGTTFDSESGEVLLTPGECHYAEVVIPNDVRIDSELRVVVELRSSHGFELTSSLGITSILRKQSRRQLTTKAGRTGAACGSTGLSI